MKASANGKRSPTLSSKPAATKAKAASIKPAEPSSKPADPSIIEVEAIATENPKPLPPPLPPPPVSHPESDPAATATKRAAYLSKESQPASPLSTAFRSIQPTWRNYIQYVDSAAREGNPDAQRYLECWNALTFKEKQAHWPEQVCDLANLKPQDLIGMVTSACWASSSAEASLVAAMMRTPVLSKTAEFAIAAPDNFAHAKLFMQSTGMLPAAGKGGGSTHNIFVGAQANLSGTELLGGLRTGKNVEPTAGGRLLDMDDEVIFTSQQMSEDGRDGRDGRLPATTSIIDATEAEAEEEEDEDEDEDED